MTAVEAYISERSGNQLALFNYFHELLYERLELAAKIRFGIPFYFHRSWICYLNPVKGDGVELAFLRGNELADSRNMLDGKGRKQVKGIIFYKKEDIKEDYIWEIIQEALILDETKPYESKRKKKK